MPDILLHPAAQAEYEAAVNWYHARSPQAASRFEAAIERTLAMIASSPDNFPTYDDEHRFAVLRRFPYSVVYQPQPTRVYVVALAHSSRSPGYWRGRI